ncbi:AGAP003877-PA [Anopheles gambiae str. PEST]|uniref:AGAP003877-PA n=1 Tax=Anopheles gambiae TaxID=7165 RepID=A0NCB9_ANOGA|nr:AGAP003877-PA [Anopheles gambiae str. PEST]
MRCSVCNYYSWSYFIAFGEIFISFHIARAFLHCARSTSFSQKLRNEKLLQIYQTCTITLKASAIVRRIVLSATEYDGRNDGKTIIEIKLIIVFTLIFTLEALVVAGACRKMRREQQEQLYYIDVV